MVKRSPFFYGWVIVGMAVFTLPLVYGTRNSFSVFFSSILDEFGWGRGSTAIMLSLNVLIYGLLGPIVGNLADRWKPRKVMLIGIIILGIGTGGCAFAQELWHFYLLFGIVMPIGAAFSGWPLFAPAIANWFSMRRGLVLGLGQAGGGLSFVYAMFANFAISQWGWRHAFLVLAGTLVVLLLPLCLFLFHYRPEHKGVSAYGSAERSTTVESMGEVTVPKDVLSQDWDLSSAMRTSRLWLLVLSYFLYWGIGIYLVLAHQVKFTEDVGYSSMFAVSVFALYGVFMVAGQFSAFVSDWVGREITVTIATVLSVVGLVALVMVKDASAPWLLYIYAICFGSGAGLYTPTASAGMADMFYGRNYGTIVGLLLAGMGLGGAIGPWLGGYMYDISGSYFSAFVVSIVCLALACVTFWLAAPRHATRLQAKT